MTLQQQGQKLMVPCWKVLQIYSYNYFENNLKCAKNKKKKEKIAAREIQIKQRFQQD